MSLFAGKSFSVPLVASGPAATLQVCRSPLTRRLLCSLKSETLWFWRVFPSTSWRSTPQVGVSTSTRASSVLTARTSPRPDSSIRRRRGSETPFSSRHTRPIGSSDRGSSKRPVLGRRARMALDKVQGRTLLQKGCRKCRVIVAVATASRRDTATPARRRLAPVARSFCALPLREAMHTILRAGRRRFGSGDVSSSFDSCYTPSIGPHGKGLR